MPIHVIYCSDFLSQQELYDNTLFHRYKNASMMIHICHGFLKHIQEGTISCVLYILEFNKKYKEIQPIDAIYKKKKE